MLNTKANLADPDTTYAEILAAHQGLSERQSHALNAELVLILASHIGDAEVLTQALALARQGKG